MKFEYTRPTLFATINVYLLTDPASNWLIVTAPFWPAEGVVNCWIVGIFLESNVKPS